MSEPITLASLEAIGAAAGERRILAYPLSPDAPYPRSRNWPISYDTISARLIPYHWQGVLGRWPIFKSARAPQLDNLPVSTPFDYLLPGVGIAGLDYIMRTEFRSLFYPGADDWFTSRIGLPIAEKDLTDIYDNFVIMRFAFATFSSTWSLAGYVDYVDGNGVSRRVDFAGKDLHDDIDTPSGSFSPGYLYSSDNGVIRHKTTITAATVDVNYGILLGQGWSAPASFYVVLPIRYSGFNDGDTAISNQQYLRCERCSLISTSSVSGVSHQTWSVPVSLFRTSALNRWGYERCEVFAYSSYYFVFNFSPLVTPAPFPSANATAN